MQKIDECGVCGGVGACKLTLQSGNTLLRVISFEPALFSSIVALFAQLDVTDMGFVHMHKMLATQYTPFFLRIGAADRILALMDTDSSASADPSEFRKGFVLFIFIEITCFELLINS